MVNKRLCVGAAVLLAAGGHPFAQSAGDREKSIMAFKRIAQVMHSPRYRNGNRTAKGLVIHMLNDPLVQWAWTPGAGRTVPTIGQDDFHTLLQRWQSTGAACPPSD